MESDLPSSVTDPQRLASLYATELLDSPPEQSFDKLTELIQRLLDVPVALVSLVDKNRQFFKSQCGLPDPWATMRETPLSHSFCQHVVHQGKPLIICNAKKEPLVCQNGAVKDLNVIAYLGIPLITPEGYTIGSFCAIDGEPREWTENEQKLMTSVAEVVISEIAARYTMRLYKQAKQEINSPLQEIIHAADLAQKRLDLPLNHPISELLSSIHRYGQEITQQLNQTPQATK